MSFEQYLNCFFLFVIFICIHFNHFFVVDITSGIAEMKISDWRGFSFFKYIVDFFFVLTCLSDRIPPIVTCASTAKKKDVCDYLKSVSITCHKLFLDCLEIIIDDYDLELFLEPSQTVFERLGNFKKHERAGILYHKREKSQRTVGRRRKISAKLLVSLNFDCSLKSAISCFLKFLSLSKIITQKSHLNEFFTIYRL